MPLRWLVRWEHGWQSRLARSAEGASLTETKDRYPAAWCVNLHALWSVGVDTTVFGGLRTVPQNTSPLPLASA